MSFGAGGLAQMTYNHNGLNGGINLPNSGFASRHGGANMKRLSIVAPSHDEEVAQAPKSSRAQLLSGLRTAPKNAAIPGTAPATQTQFPINRKQSPPSQQSHLAVPQTATAASFGGQANQHLNVASAAPRGHHYTPSQVMSPPAITLESDEGQEDVDPSYYENLVRMNQHLAQQQERLKQQLVAVTQQAQQMGLNPQQAAYYAQMMASQAGLYSQQMQQQVQPIVQPVPNNPGYYSVYNPMTGEVNYVFDQASQQMAFAPDASMNDQFLSHSPPPATPTFKNSFEQPSQNHTRSNNWRSSSPPKHAPTSATREEPMALPPPSANAYRPGHKKTTSLMPSSSSGSDAPVKLNLAPRGNFGPSQSKEGEHPVRQPRGPPSLDELVAKPTSKHEGSKNFASRQRRAAINNIISAGAARRSCGSSNASLSPTSERDELVFSSAEDNDTASVRSGSSQQRAIGSERKERAERESRERERKNSFEAKSVSSEEGLVEVQNRLGAMGFGDDKEKRRSAVLLMKGAGQRRSMMY